jgi:hypothetical protein
MKTYVGVEVEPHHSSPLHQKEVSGQLRAPIALLPWKDATEKTKISFPCQESNSGRSARRYTD